MGAACVRRFAAHGASVVIVDRNGPLAAEVAESIGSGDPMIGDVADSAFCNEVHFFASPDAAQPGLDKASRGGGAA